MKDDIDRLDRVRAANKREFIEKWATKLSGKTMRFLVIRMNQPLQEDGLREFLVDLEFVAGNMFDEAINTECPT